MIFRSLAIAAAHVCSLPWTQAIALPPNPPSLSFTEYYNALPSARPQVPATNASLVAPSIYPVPDPVTIGPISVVDSENKTLTPGLIRFSEYDYDADDQFSWHPVALARFFREAHQNIFWAQKRRFRAGVDEEVEGGIYTYKDTIFDIDFSFWQDMESAQRDFSWRDLYAVVSAAARWVQYWEGTGRNVPFVTIELLIGPVPGVRQGMGQLRHVRAEGEKAVEKPTVAVESS
ncbi:MAG: hypothetical protein Q9217_005929 [Psora testacea]